MVNLLLLELAESLAVSRRRVASEKVKKLHFKQPKYFSYFIFRESAPVLAS